MSIKHCNCLLLTVSGSTSGILVSTECFDLGFLFCLCFFEIYVDQPHFVATVCTSEELHLYQGISAAQNESPKGHCSVNVTAPAIPHLPGMHSKRWRNLEEGGQNLMVALSNLKGAMNHGSVTKDLCKAAAVFQPRNFAASL